MENRICPVKSLMIITLLLGIFIVTAVDVQVVFAEAISVTTNVDEDIDNGDCSLREAIILANHGSLLIYNGCSRASTDDKTIDLTAGVFTLNSMLPTITATVTILGAGKEDTIIQASSCNPISLPDGCSPANYRILEISSVGELDLQSLTLRHGKDPDYGGAIFNDQGILTMSDCVVRNNKSIHGGGLCNNDDGLITLTNVDIVDNLATIFGGGIYNVGSISGEDCLVYGNKANIGGGITNAIDLDLENCVVSKNESNQNAAGLFNSSTGTMTLENNLISENIAKGSGGGVFNDGGWTDDDSIIADNIATSGGGIYNNGNLTSIGMVLESNQGSSGGGLYNNGQANLVDTTINGNTSKYDGGGIFNYDELSITNSTISTNTAGTEYGSGGGFYNLATVIVSNSTISGNNSFRYGGGIYNDDTITISHATISGNTASLSGGGIYNTVGTVNYVNTIVANSTNYDCYNLSGTIGTQSHNLVESHSNCGTPYLTSDPELRPLGKNGGPTKTHPLMSHSPAIDQADPAYCPATDQRGVDRPVDGDGDDIAVCDIGAYEYDVMPTYLPLMMR